MKTILANTELSFKGIELLEKAGYKVINQSNQGDDLITYINTELISIVFLESKDVSERLLEDCKGIKVIGCSEEPKAFENLQKKFPEVTFVITNEANNQAIAELVFAHLLGMVRFLYDANRQMPLEGEVNFTGMQQAYSKGSEIKGKTLGLIGLNNGAVATIKMAIALGLNVIVFDNNTVKKTIALDLPNNETYDFDLEIKPLEEVLMKSDYISMHCLEKDNIVLKKEEFELMKLGVCLINTSHQGAIDEVELIQAIDSGIVKHASLDCFDNQPKPDMRILMNQNISLSPDIAKYTLEASIKIGEVFAKYVIGQ